MKKCNPYGDDLNVPPALKNNPNLPESPGSGSVIAGADGPIVVLRERMRKEKRNGFYVMGAKTIPKRGPQVFSCTFTAEYIEKLLRLDPIVAHSLSTLDTSVAFKKRVAQYSRGHVSQTSLLDAGILRMRNNEASSFRTSDSAILEEACKWLTEFR